MEEKEIKIYASKKKIALQGFLTISMFVAAYFLLKLGLMGIPIMMFCVGVLGIFIVGKYLLLNKPLLIINEKGIKDNMNFPPVGFVEWENINYAKKEKISGFNNIMIYLKDEDKFIGQQSFLKKMFLKSNRDQIGTCVFFRCTVFENPDEVLAFINNMIALNKN